MKTRFAALLTLSACVTDPGPVYHLLQAPESAIEAPVPSGPVLGLREIALPLYARRPQMAVRTSAGEILLVDSHRWAEEPPRAATRLLARLLAGLTGRPIAVEPWSIDIDPKTLVQIEADYLIGSLGGDLRFSGQFRVIDRTGRKAVVISPFEISERVAGPTHADLAAAHRAAVGRLAERVAGALELYAN